MKMTYIHEEREVADFAERAGVHFKEHPEHRSYTDSEIVKGCLFALRFGLGEDCVVVFKLDEDFDVINFQQAVPSSNIQHERA